MRPARLLDPLALVIAGAGLATAVLTGIWWIAALGAVGWLVVAAMGGETPVAPAPTEPQLDGAYALTAERLERLRQRIADSVAGAAPVVRGCMEDVPSQVATLVAQCRRLLFKQAELDRFLNEADDPLRDAERLAEAADQACDPTVRERWRQAEASARARIDELAQIRTNRERTAADLAEVETRLKQVLSQVVSMDSLDQGRLTGLSSELHANLGELAQQVTVMDRVLRPEAEAADDPPPRGQAQ